MPVILLFTCLENVVVAPPVEGPVPAVALLLPGTAVEPPTPPRTAVPPPVEDAFIGPASVASPSCTLLAQPKAVIASVIRVKEGSLGRF